MRTVPTFFFIVSFGWSISGQESILPSVQSHRTDIFRLDSLRLWLVDTTNNWALYNSTSYTYDENQNIATVTVRGWDEFQNWIDLERDTNTYDDKNNLIMNRHWEWDGSEWNGIQNLYAYNSNGDRTHELVQTLNNDSWQNYYQNIYVYDDDHHELTSLFQLWLGADWNAGTKRVSTYDTNGRLIIRVIQNWNGTAWNDISRTLYAYDVNNDLDTLLSQKWNFNTWTDDYRNLYDFDAHHNRILILEQLAVGINFWVDQDKYEYMYDQYDHITHLIYSHYDNNAWSNVYQYNIINDGNQNRATEVFQNWNNGWVNADSTQYYYTGITATHNFLNHLEMTMVPNPTSDYLFVEYPKPIDGTIGIYSIQGVKLLELKSNHEQSFRINVASLMPGVYFVALHVGGQVLTKGFEKL